MNDKFGDRLQDISEDHNRKIDEEVAERMSNKAKFLEEGRLKKEKFDKDKEKNHQRLKPLLKELVEILNTVNNKALKDRGRTEVHISEFDSTPVLNYEVILRWEQGVSGYQRICFCGHSDGSIELVSGETVMLKTTFNDKRWKNEIENLLVKIIFTRNHFYSTSVESPGWGVDL